MELLGTEKTKFIYYSSDIEKKLRDTFLKFQRIIPLLSTIDLTIIYTSIDDILSILSKEAFIYKTSKLMVSACTLILRLYVFFFFKNYIYKEREKMNIMGWMI